MGPMIPLIRYPFDTLMVRVGSGYGTGPPISVRMRYRPVLAVMKSCSPARPPQAQFAGTSGVLIRPRKLPSGEYTQTPPGPVVHTLPALSVLRPSVVPCSGALGFAKRRSLLSDPDSATL